MAARKKSNRYEKRLLQLAKDLGKARPKARHRLLFEAFEVVAAAGSVKHASALLDWAYGPRSPAPTEVATALSTAAIDGFCYAAGLGDRTRGLPRHERTVTSHGPLAERVREAEQTVRGRLTMNAYGDAMPSTDAWMNKPPNDRWRSIDRWRRIQRLVQEGREADALDRLVSLLGEQSADERGAGYGDELVLALDLALRLGREELIGGWLTRHGHRFESEGLLLQLSLCLPLVAAKLAEGLLRATIGLSEQDLDAAMAALDAALTLSNAALPVKAAVQVQKRRVSCEYSQVHLQPESLDEAELSQVFFQKPDDSQQGMSLFPTKVGIATPSDTDYVDAEITLSDEREPALADVVQAVAFPLVVRGPLVLASVSSDGEEEPLAIPPGTYDVLARFVPKKAPKASASAGLRVFALRLSFHPTMSLGAPRTLRVE